MRAYAESYPQLKADGKLKHVYPVVEDDYDPYDEPGRPYPWPPEGLWEGAWADDYEPPSPLDEEKVPPCPALTSAAPRPGRLDCPDTSPTSAFSGPGKTLARDDPERRSRQRPAASDASPSTSAEPSAAQPTREQSRGPPTPAERSLPSRENTGGEKSGPSKESGKAAQGKQRR